MNKIIILDDEVSIVQILKLMFEANDFQVHCFYSAEEFFNSKENYGNCIYIVDAGLPGIQGGDVIKTIRFKDKLSPIFMISGTDCQTKINTGLLSGADDYIVKPFDIDTLLAKVVNANRKNSFVRAGMVSSEFRKIPESQCLMRNGKFVKLTISEYNIVDSILLGEGCQKSRQEIIAGSKNGEITERTIDVHIHSIRKKLVNANMSIQSVRGIGYKIIFN